MPRLRHEDFNSSAWPQHDPADAACVLRLQGIRFASYLAVVFWLVHLLFLHLNHLFVLDRQLCWFSFVTGEVISEKDKCGQCKGQKVVQDKKMLEVHVEKGMQHGQKITFQGEADEAVMILFKFQFSILELQHGDSHHLQFLQGYVRVVACCGSVVFVLLFAVELESHAMVIRILLLLVDCLS
jgi:hypothetical protein